MSEGCAELIYLDKDIRNATGMTFYRARVALNNLNYKFEDDGN